VDGRLFEGEEQVFHLIERIVSPLGLRVDESMPYVDARLSDGSRVNAIIPPLSLCGPVITIRKFTLRPLTPADLIRLGTASEDMMSFLGACVRARANVMVSGGTGSGKTTLLGALSSFISHGERLITIEDAAELRLEQPHVVSLESRPPNLEGVGEVSIRTLVRNALRMRPDRIILGEVRGGEALDMLQAMNTGHEGSLSTAHANSPRDLLSRLETMALMSDVDLPVSHVREQIGGALDLVVHMSRHPDGRRVVAAICAVAEMRSGAVDLVDLFGWRRSEGRFAFIPPAAGVAPPILRRLSELGEAGSLPRFESTAATASSAGEVAGRPRPEPRPSPSRVRRGGVVWPWSPRRLGAVLE
jgi:pilus assembly protein CpaF